MSKGKTIASWVLQVVLAALFALAGLGKLTAPAVVDQFSAWGFPDGFHLVIGVLELAGAIGLLIPRTVGYAAMGLFGLMIGAALTHLLNGEDLQVLRPLVFMVPLAVIVFLRRPWPLARTSQRRS
jgi:uncharacterized membrane protein YphA (DoxX/SURF4 family)